MNFPYTYQMKNLLINNPNSKSHLQQSYNYMLLALGGKVAHSFYIFPFDTGFGKTTLILDFLAGWKANGFKPEGSILIALNTKAEIVELIIRSDLDEDDYACFTKDDEVNSLGTLAHTPTKARVLFTTQAMLRARLRNKNFAAADEFHYNSQPRSLRIWDERCLRAEPIHITLDSIVKLYEPIRPHCSDWVEGLEAFVYKAIAAGEGAVVTLPKRFGKGAQFAAVNGGPAVLNPDQLEALKKLKAAGGRRLRIIKGKKFGLTLVGAGPALPADLAPMFIFDASARIGDSYALWGAKEPVVVAPPLIRAYRNLTVRIWRKSCGQKVLLDATERNYLLRGIASTIGSTPAPTLLIGSKARPGLFDLQEELRSYLDTPEKSHFLHWGRHYGTNDFASIEQVVVVGTHPHRETSDQADYMAASGLEPEQVKGDEWKAMRQANLKQNLLQAFSRGNLRNGSGMECGKSTIYLIAPANPNPEQLVRDIFPGCTIEAWEPYGISLKGQARAIYDTLDTLVAAGRTGEVTKQEVRVAASIGSASRLAQLLANRALLDNLRTIGVTLTNKSFVLQPLSSAVTISTLRERWKQKQVARDTIDGAGFALAA